MMNKTKQNNTRDYVKMIAPMTLAVLTLMLTGCGHSDVAADSISEPIPVTAIACCDAQQAHLDEANDEKVTVQTVDGEEAAEAETPAAVSRKSANVYADTDDASDVITVLYRNDRVIVLGEYDYYYAVQYSGGRGFINKDCVSIICESENDREQGSTEIGTVSKKSIYVRSNPNMSGEILGVAYRNDELTIQAQHGNWYEVAYNGTCGYVWHDYVNVG